MPTINITNQVASQALRGESVKVTVDLSTQSSEFNQLEIGQSCLYAGDTDYYGLISSIDSFGNSFEVTPIQPNLKFGNYGYLFSAEIVTITL